MSRSVIRAKSGIQAHRYSAALIHALNLRDEGRCTDLDFQDNRCTNRCSLEFHHQIPRALGGLDTVENLITLCRIHHQLRHESHRESD